MDDWLAGDYVKDRNGRIYQVVRIHHSALYLEDVLAANRLILPCTEVLRITPKETARALVEAWLSADFFAMD